MDKKDISEEQKALAGRLRNVRIQLGYTQEKFAEILDVACSTYKKIEKGESGITVTQLRLLKAKLDISIDYLLFGDSKDFDKTWMNVQNLDENDKICLFLRLHAYLKDNSRIALEAPETLTHKNAQIQEILKLFTADK